MWKRKNKSVCYIIFIIIPTIPRASPNALNKWWHSPQSWLMTYAFILQKTRKLPVDFLIPAQLRFYIKRAIVNRPVHGNMSSDIVVIACCNNSRTFRRIHVVLFVSIIIPFLVSSFFLLFQTRDLYRTAYTHDIRYLIISEKRLLFIRYSAIYTHTDLFYYYTEWFTKHAHHHFFQLTMNLFKLWCLEYFVL